MPDNTEDREFIHLLAKMRRMGWTIYQWSRDPAKGTDILGAVYFWDDQGAADVVILHENADASAFRTPPCRDVFMPEYVTEHVLGKPVYVVRTAITWDPYGHERVQRPLVPPQASFVLPTAFRHQFTETVIVPGSQVAAVRPALVVPPAPSAPAASQPAGAITRARAGIFG
jgi:hypothetical protein